MSESRSGEQIVFGTCPQCSTASQLFGAGYCAICTMGHQQTQIKALQQVNAELRVASENRTSEDSIRDDECNKIIEALDARGSASTLIHPHEAQVTHRKQLTIRAFLQQRIEIRLIQRSKK